MPRRVTAKTKLGALILKSRKPSYKVAGEVGIAFTQMSRYVNLHEPIQPHHLRALAAYFKVEPEDLVGLLDTDQPGGRTPEVDERATRELPRRTGRPLYQGSTS